MAVVSYQRRRSGGPRVKMSLAGLPPVPIGYCQPVVLAEIHFFLRRSFVELLDIKLPLCAPITDLVVTAGSF